ncbi:MAG: hypothetical protein V8R80_01740 [Eubacterium sp.]
MALTGALLHVIFHAFIKTALFLSAGAIIYQTGKTRVDELRESEKRCRQRSGAIRSWHSH